MKRVIFSVLLLFLSTSSFGQTSKSVQGRITELEYPRFTLINFNVLLDEHTSYYVKGGGAPVLTPIRPELLKEDEEVEAKGQLDANSKILRADSVTFLLKRDFIAEVGTTAMIDHAPNLRKAETGWMGTIHADGRNLVIDDRTELKLLPETDPQQFDKLGPNMFVAYVGKIRLDGSIHVDRAAFWKNDVDGDELKMRKRDEPVITPSDPSHKKPVFLTIHDGRPMPLLEDDPLQKRVSEIGLKLVPEYQKSLPASDPTKLDFRFYVVRSKSRIVLDALNGVVLVPDSILKNLQNEAQLASLLSVAVAQVIEKQEYQSRHRRHLQQASAWLLTGAGAIPSPLALLALPAQIANSKSFRSYMTDMAQQAARVGVGYMLAAGYDPREAPVAWKLTLQKHPEKNDELPEFGKYVKTELETSYWKTDFSGLRVGAEEYREVVKVLQ